MSSTGAQLSALVSLISDATKTVEALFQGSSKPFVPSLDDPIPHPFDTEISSREMKRAVQIIEGACAQLCATVAHPNHTIVNKLMGIYESGCLHVAVMFKIPDILQEKPSGMHVSEIGQKSGVEVGKIGRILRLLAMKHCFREVTTNVFANNRISLQLLSTNPLSSFALHLGDENYKSTSMLAETLADPAWGPSYSPEHAPFNMWSKYPRSMFSWYEGDTPEGGQRGTRFSVGVQGWNATIEAGAVIKRFPWGELPDGATVCDVGGGIGHITMQLAKAYPNLKLKLQDTPERILQAKTVVWPAQCPEAIQEDRVEFKALDFLAESPIKDCDVYYLKNVIHDWPDNEGIKVLGGIRDVMTRSSRLLIHEYILQPLIRVPEDRSDFHQAPEPLLPNYGVGRIRQYNIDIDLMILANSKQRTLAEYVELVNKAGLRFVKLWDLDETGVMEFHLA